MFCKRLNGKCQFKKLCIYLCVVLALSLFASPVSAQIDWGAVENQIEGIRSNYNLPSIGYALVVEDTPVFTGAVGQANISENIDTTADTPYQLASISKTFIAAALLQLIEAGVLSLDDPVNDQLPWTLGFYSAARPGYFHLRKELRVPEADKLFFAGEAGEPTEFGSCHGGYLNGIRMANKVIDVL